MTSQPEGRLWQGMTVDVRVADRRARLVEAGFELLGTQGAAALTMRAACRDAAVGPRYFYELFRDREDLLVAVYEEAVERIRGPLLIAAQTAAATGTVRTAVAHTLEKAIGLIEDDPRIGRVLWREAAADGTLRPLSQAAMGEFILTLVDEVRPDRADELRRPDQGWTLIGVSAAVFALFLAWSEGIRPTSRDKFVQHCADFVADQLGLDA